MQHTLVMPETIKVAQPRDFLVTGILRLVSFGLHLKQHFTSVRRSDLLQMCVFAASANSDLLSDYVSIYAYMPMHRVVSWK